MEFEEPCPIGEVIFIAPGETQEVTLEKKQP
jgi:hypothetical protein